MEKKINNYFNRAIDKLHLSKEELFKPEEDLMQYAVCKNAQISIANYLKGFLLTHGVEAKEEDTIESLYKQCIEFDNDFKNIDISSITCKNHKTDSHFCTETSKVSACYDAADSIDTYFRKRRFF